MKNVQPSLLLAFEQSKMTYDELARKTKIPKSAVHRYVNGDTEKIPIDRFQRICDALGIDAAEILEWRPDLTPHIVGADPVLPLSDDECSIVVTYRCLSPDGKKYLLQQAQIARITFGEKSAAISDVEGSK